MQLPSELGLHIIHHIIYRQVVWLKEEDKDLC